MTGGGAGRMDEREYEEMLRRGGLPNKIAPVPSPASNAETRSPGWNGYRDMDQPISPPPAEPPSTEPDLVAVAAALQRMRVTTEARRLLAIEEHERSWQPPISRGHLGVELGIPDLVEPWRIKGLLGVGDNAILVATRKSGKTVMVNNLVRSLVDGDPFLAKFETSPVEGSVAVLNYEVGENRYRAWLRRQGIVNTHRVHVLHVRGQTLPLASAHVRDWLVEWLRSRGVSVVVFDPYSRAYLGTVADGDREAQVSAFLDTLDVIKERAGVGELVMPVHTPKAKVDSGEETAIGSQRLEAWPDSMWYLTRDRETGLRFLRAEGRDVELDEEQLTFDPVTQRLVFGGWNRETSRTKADVATVVDFITANQGCTQRAIEGGLEWGRARVAKAVAAAGNKVRTQPGSGRSTLHFAGPELRVVPESE